MQKLYVYKISIAVIGLMLLALILLYAFNTKVAFGEKPPQSFAEMGGDFTLLSMQGEVSLSDYLGKAIVLYFGFLHCPDICPTSMVTIAQALRKLPQEKANDVKVLLVSVDPNRDTPAAVDEYAKYFHPNSVGLTGDKNILDQVVKKYGAYYEISDDLSAENGFGVEHTTRYYIIDKTGRLVDALRQSTTSNELAAKLETII